MYITIPEAENRTVQATGHKYESKVTAPTCTEAGYTTHTCACGHSYTDGHTFALDHDMSEWTVAKAPTCTADGTERRACSRCGHTENRMVSALGHDWVDNTCARCKETRKNPFTDVPENKWYTSPVLWAVEKGITAGTKPDEFSPDDPCTRAQIVTFLYRAMAQIPEA